MQLAGILLKIAVVTIIRLVICPFWDHVVYFSPLLACLVASGLVSSCSAALANCDIKRYIASCSVIHMMIALPAITLAVLDCFSASGSLICFVAHSWITVQLFLVSDNLYGSSSSRWTSGANTSALALLSLITQACGFPNSIQCNGELMIVGGLIAHSHAFGSFMVVGSCMIISGILI
jgi:NADH:ubiquinone oxidoreductase subunit 4 (subunit M)